MFCLMLLALIKPFYEGEPIELIQIQVIASFMLPDFCYQFTDPKVTKLSFSLYSAVYFSIYQSFSNRGLYLTFILSCYPSCCSSN